MATSRDPALPSPAEQAREMASLFEQMANTVDDYRVLHLPELSAGERMQLVALTQKLDDIHDQFTVTAIQDTLEQIQDEVAKIKDVTAQAAAALKHLERVAEIAALVSAAAELGSDVLTADFGDIPTAIQTVVQAVTKKADKDTSGQKSDSTS